MGFLDTLFGTSKARKDINQTSAQAQAALDEARGRAEGSLTSGRDVARGDVNDWFNRAAAGLTGAQPGIRSDINAGYDAATGALTRGYGEADARLAAGEAGARGDLIAGHGQARSDLMAGYQGAEAAMTPWAESGGRAQGLYDQALGVGAGGADAQRSFYDNYAQNDPYREYRDELANRQIQRQFASSGRTGAMSMALGRASLERGSQDLQTYLSRLEQAGQRGQAASGQIAGYRAQGGQALAGNETARGSALSNIGMTTAANRANMAGQRGQGLATMATDRAGALSNLGMQFANNQANLATQRAGQLAGLASGTGSALSDLIYGAGQQTASNRINTGNAIAATRTQPMQNLINLAGTAVKAYAGMPR